MQFVNLGSCKNSVSVNPTLEMMLETDLPNPSVVLAIDDESAPCNAAAEKGTRAARDCSSICHWFVNLAPALNPEFRRIRTMALSGIG